MKPHASQAKDTRTPVGISIYPPAFFVFFFFTFSSSQSHYFRLSPWQPSQPNISKIGEIHRLRREMAIRPTNAA